MATVIQASGRVVRDADGLELIVSRRLPLPLAEAWEWVTAPAKLKQWIGTVKGRPELGATVQLTMTAEHGSPTEPAEIVECEPLLRYVLQQRSAGEVWTLRVSMAEADGQTMVFLGHRLDNARIAGSIGPGWEWYLDRLRAAITGEDMPAFEDYYPQQKPYYERIAMDGDPVGWPAS